MSLKSRAEKAATPENIAKLRAQLRAKGNAQMSAAARDAALHHVGSSSFDPATYTSSEQLDDIVAIAVGSPIQSAIATGRLMASMVRPKRDGG